LGRGSGGTSFQLVDALLHLLAWFECHHEFFRHKDLLPRTGVAGFTRGPFFYLKHAKIAQFDPLIFNKSINDGIERFLDDFLGFELSQPYFFRDRFNNFFLGHDEIP